MFDTIRNNSKILMGLLFLLIIPSFVLFGVDGYQQLDEKGAVVAKVDGQKITQVEWDAAHQREVDRIRASMPNLDAKLLGSDDARYATLERLVNDRVIALASEKQLLVTSNQRLANYLQQDPSIAGLRGADGKLDMDKYRQLAASQGMTPEMLEAQVRRDLSQKQVLSTLQASVISSKLQSEGALQAFLQQRQIQVQRFEPAAFSNKVQVTVPELEKFYQAQSDLFRSVESADIEFLVLDSASMEKTITLPEQDIKTYYDQNLQRLAGQEQRRASHILINAAKDAPASDREKAKLKAETLLADLRKDPRNFADVTRKNSQDTASASKGGDLDFFAKGAMVKAFEDAAFSLKKGDISSVVESDFGYHIILLTDIKAAAAPSFEAMRPQLEADLRKQQAKRQFAEYAETFSNSVYEQADTFKPVAEKLKLTVQSAKGLTRSPSPASEGFLANPKLLEAVFAEDSVSKRRNTAAMEVGNNTLVSARIINHRPAVLRPFAEVKDAVRVQYIQQEALKLAKSEGQAKLLEWKNKPELAQLGAPLLVSRDQTQGQPQALIDAALRADPVNVPSFLGVDLGLQGFALVRLNKLVPRDPLNAQQQDQSRQQFARLLANAEANAYLVYLRTQFKAEILVPQPKTSTGS